MYWFVGSSVFLCFALIWYIVGRARDNRALGRTPDGIPIPTFGDYVSALLDAPILHGGRAIQSQDCDPACVQGVVLRTYDNMTMDVMDRHGNHHRCMIVGYVFPEFTPSWVYEFLKKPNPNLHIH